MVRIDIRRTRRPAFPPTEDTSMNERVLRRPVRLGLAIAGLALTTIVGETSAQIDCGGVVGPKQTVTLTGNVGPCDGGSVALTVDAGTLDLGGFSLICDDTDENGAVPDGIALTGKKARLRNGSVVGCDTGVLVLGDGKATVEGVTASNSVNDGIGVGSDKNKITGNNASGNGEDGIDLISSADKNKVTGNTFSSNGDEGIDVSGSKNKLIGNTANANGSDGIDAGPSTRKNKIVGNTVTGNGGADLQSSGGPCKANVWKKNTFQTSSDSCLK
jgi:parallel beta-helix repeat protein